MQVQVFSFKGANVRTVMRDSQPWWVAKDVCEVLGIKDHRSGVRNLRDYEKGEHIVPTPSGHQGMTVISESGLYKLILKSRVPSAEAFQDWVTQDVLPSIRQTGSYSVAPVPTSEVDRLAGVLAQTFPVIAGQIQVAQQTADDAKALAAAAPAAALEALKVEQADRADLRRDLMKAVEGLVDEAVRRGFFDGNRRAAFQNINSDIRDRFGVRDAMPSDRLRLALSYVNERHAKLTDPNRLPFTS